MPDVIEIHTSDLISFKRCRRRWNWTSPLRGNLVQGDSPAVSALWLGSGFHFALEDFHGYNRFGHPVDAFMAYINAHKYQQLPEDVDDLTELGCSMLSYYADMWLLKPGREQFNTLYLSQSEPNTIDIPAVEFKWAIPLPITGPNGESVHFAGTFDRVVRDAEKRIWVIDYKTAASMASGGLETDSQVSGYTYAARKLFGSDVEGVIWQQHLKKQATGPALLKNGEFSKNKAAGVPWLLYNAALIERYGKVPAEYREHMAALLEEETEYGDAFVRQTRIRRSPKSSANFEKQLLDTVEDMLNSELKVYPNPTRDCAWDCQVRTACITMDDGYDYEDVLEQNFISRPEETDWRERIEWPHGIEEM